MHISIHASLVGGDEQQWLKVTINGIFQSTPPSWEATADSGKNYCDIKFQSTPPSWEATVLRCRGTVAAPISIHASLVGGDNPECMYRDLYLSFQSTPPSWEATGGRKKKRKPSNISIHASLVGGDVTITAYVTAAIISIHASLVGGD